MPIARQWTADADATIRHMRGQGATWAQIGNMLGLSRNTVIERGRRIRAEAPSRPVQEVESENLDDPERGALPAGHPLTWGLLTTEPFPKKVSN